MHWLSNNRLKLESLGESPVILEESIEYTFNERKAKPEDANM
jgi:hypothetical protein